MNANPVVTRLSQIPNLFHFTDTRNLPSIRQNGGLLSLYLLRDRKLSVPAPGGNEWSHDADKRANLHRYVHLCFRNQHPMEHVAKQQGRIYSTIFLIINPMILHKPGVLFSPDVSNKSGVRTMPLPMANTVIDFEVLYTWTDWKNPRVKERLNKASKHEILVPASVPLSFIQNI